MLPLNLKNHIFSNYIPYSSNSFAIKNQMPYVFQVSLTICNFLFVCLFVFWCFVQFFLFFGGFFCIIFFACSIYLNINYYIKCLQCSLIEFFVFHYFFSFSSRYYVPVLKNQYFEIQYLVYFVNTGLLHLFSVGFRKKIFVLFFVMLSY